MIGGSLNVHEWDADTETEWAVITKNVNNTNWLTVAAVSGATSADLTIFCKSRKDTILRLHQLRHAVEQAIKEL